MTPSARNTATYANGRRILDADAHIMEPDGWLASFAPAAIRDRIPPSDLGAPDMREKLDRAGALVEQRAADPGERETAEAEIMTMPRKGWGAYGDGDSVERSAAMDVLGFEAQLVFPTGSFNQAVAADDDVFIEAVAAMNTGMATFCADDERLLSVGYVPFKVGADDALDVLQRAVAAGNDSVAIDMVPAIGTPSHTHPDFDPVWSAIVDADLPVMLHVGLDNGFRPVRKEFFDNGRELAHFRSDAPGDALSFLAIGQPAEVFIGSMIFDGVLDRHPGLRLGVAELGATWVPSLLPFLDTAARSFRRMQDLSHLRMDASDYVRQHFCFSPFAGEDVGFMLDAGGDELFMFSSDYPHHEGSDDPIGRFERTMPTATEAQRQAFYRDNFARLMGDRLPSCAR